MVNGLLELTDCFGMDYYFVSVSLKEEAIQIKNFNAYCKLINKTVQLAEIEQLVFSKIKGISYVSFDYDHEHYCFADYDNQIVNSFKEKVFGKQVNEPIF